MAGTKHFISIIGGYDAAVVLFVLGVRILFLNVPWFSKWNLK